MNRQQRRAQRRNRRRLRPQGQFITMPIGELSALFGLTDDEVTEDGQRSGSTVCREGRR